MDHFLVSALLILDLIYGLFYLNFDLFNQNWFLLIIAYLISVILILSASRVGILGKTYFLDVAL